MALNPHIERLASRRQSVVDVLIDRFPQHSNDAITRVPSLRDYDKDTELWRERLQLKLRELSPANTKNPAVQDSLPVSAANLPSGTTLNSVTIARYQSALITGVAADGTVTITMANAFTTANYQVQIIKVSTGETWAVLSVARSSANQFVITFSSQVSDNEFRWVAVGD